MQLRPGELESQAAEYGCRVPMDIWRLVQHLKHVSPGRETA
jgi:hypothetical protein